jgi:hypothetical protein
MPENSSVEQVMVNVLDKAGKPLALNEIVEKMLHMNPFIFKGKTPKNSLYSVLYRRGKRREEMGYQPLFLKTKSGNATFYKINPKGKNFVGVRIPEK